VKAARKYYEAAASCEDEAGVMEVVSALSGREIHALHLYALGREHGETRDRVMVCCYMEAGDRYLAKQAAKAAKRVKRIF
jgi:hypothetical protein